MQSYNQLQAPHMHDN